VAQHKKEEGADDESDANAEKIVRSRALDAIKKIKKPDAGASPQRFMIVQGKLSVATYMGPSIGATQEKMLKSLIADEAPFKVFKDPQGELIWEKNAVTFVSDQLPPGLVKKMQLWLKKILDLNVKIRVRKTTGEAEESEGEDVSDELLGAGGDAPEVQAHVARDFQQRLATLQPGIRLGLAGPWANAIKERIAAIGQHGKDGNYESAADRLDEIEVLLERGTSGIDAPAEEDVDAGAMSAWMAERAGAIARLKAVAARIGAARHASSSKALVEINAVIKNLTASPSSLQQVAELQRYLGTDDVVADVSDLPKTSARPCSACSKGCRRSTSHERVISE